MSVRPFPQFLDGYLPPAGRLVPGVPAPRRPLAITPDKFAVTYDRNYDVPTDGRIYTPRLAERTSYTNYLTQSDNFTHTDWTKLNLTVTSDNAATPWDGSTAVDKLLETVTNAEHRIAQAQTFTAVAHTLWAIVKDIGRGYARLLANDGTTDFKAFYDLTSSSVISATNATAGVVVLDSGFRLLWLTFTPAAAAGNVYLNTASSGSTVSFAGDTAKGLYVAQLQLERASAYGARVVTTTAAATASVPDLDPVDPFAYLVAETDPEFQSSQHSRVRRTFARVPATQAVEGTTMVTKPAPGLASYPGALGDYRIFKPDSTLELFDAYLKKSVGGDTGIPSGFYPTGGTYTLSFGGNTTGSLNYNDAAATVQTALNALTSITNRGGVVVTSAYNDPGGLIVTFNSYATGSGNTASLTMLSGSPPPASFTLLNGGYTQTVAMNPGLTRQITGGTFTLTLFGQTTSAIAWNALASTVASALNALSNVTARGGVTVSLPVAGDGQINRDQVDGDPSNGNKIQFTINFANAVFTANSASLTPTGSLIEPAITDGVVGRTQKLVFEGTTATRTLFAYQHGVVSGDLIYIKGDSTYLAGLWDFTIIDANNIQLNVAPGTLAATATAITEVGRRTKASYEPGSQPAVVDLVTRYSLTTITPERYQGENATLLQQILAGNTAINYRVSDTARWPNQDSPIRALTTTKVSAANL